MTSLLGKIVDKTPVSFAPQGYGQGIPWTGARNDMVGQMEARGNNGTLFSITNRTSNATSQVEWYLFRTQTDGRRVTQAPDGDHRSRVQVTKHIALDLWNNPNPFMTQNELVETSQLHQDLTGENIIIVVRSPLSSMPLEIWPVRPDRMTPIPHPTEFLAGWIYTGPNGEQVPLGVDDVIQMKLPNPLDPYRGMGPVQAAMVDLDSARYGAEWNRNFFRNSAEPGGVIEFPDTLTDQEYRDFQEKWRESHQGVGNAHRIALLEYGLTWKPTQMSARDMQFTELRSLSRELLREAFGIHGHMLGNSQDVNKANAEAGEISFARWLVTPRIMRWKAMLNSRLLPMCGAEGVEFEHGRVVPEDREADDRERTSKASAAATLVSAGWQPDDVLEVVGLPAMDFDGPKGGPTAPLALPPAAPGAPLPA